MSSTNAIITRANDIGEEVTSKYIPPPRCGLWKKITKFFSNQTDSIISHGEKMESIPDLVNLHSRQASLPKIRTLVSKDDGVEHVRDKGDWDLEMMVNRDKAIVVYFKAPWCGPCRNIEPSVLEFSREFEDVVFLSVDFDEVSDVARGCGVDAVPTFQVWKNGLKVDEYIGSKTHELRNLIVNNR